MLCNGCVGLGDRPLRAKQLRLHQCSRRRTLVRLQRKWWREWPPHGRHVQAKLDHLERDREPRSRTAKIEFWTRLTLFNLRKSFYSRSPQYIQNAIIGGGARLGDVGLALSKQGRALPNGVCPWVGVGGHATGGGYGTHSSRAWGLLMDRLVSMQMVTAEGTVRNISASSANSDLFWVGRSKSTFTFQLRILIM